MVGHFRRDFIDHFGTTKSFAFVADGKQFKAGPCRLTKLKLNGRKIKNLEKNSLLLSSLTGEKVQAGIVHDG